MFLFHWFGARKVDFFNLLEPGDVVLADKGSPKIKSYLDDAENGVVLVTPLFILHGIFTKPQVQEKVASRTQYARNKNFITTTLLSECYYLSMFPDKKYANYL